MESERLRITLDRPDKIYYAGQTVKGEICLNLTKRTKIRARISTLSSLRFTRSSPVMSSLPRILGLLNPVLYTRPDFNLVCFSIFERNISPGDMCTKSNFSTMRLDIVPFPEAGGPKITARTAFLNIENSRKLNDESFVCVAGSIGLMIGKDGLHSDFWRSAIFKRSANTSGLSSSRFIKSSPVMSSLPGTLGLLNFCTSDKRLACVMLRGKPSNKKEVQLPVLDFLNQSSLDDLFDEFLLLLEFDVNDDDDLSGLYPGRCQVRLVWRAGCKWLCEGLREICLRYLWERRVDGERLWRLRGDGVPLGTNENLAGSGLIDGGGGGTCVLPNPMILKLDVEVVDFADDGVTSLLHMRIDGALGGGVSDFSRFFTAVSAAIVGIAAALLVICWACSKSSCLFLISAMLRVKVCAHGSQYHLHPAAINKLN
ncbi:hypothetical protein GQX74_015256 [Glossina fuscipes]|nr:hypothetical protein GQX74_015256 [Glossina fuscipes]